MARKPKLQPRWHGKADKIQRQHEQALERRRLQERSRAQRQAKQDQQGRERDQRS